MADQLIHYCVTVNKLDGTLGAYVWTEAESPEQARYQVRHENLLLETFWDNKQPMKEWEVRDTDIGKQMSLLEK